MLNLANPNHRDCLKCLLFINLENYKKITKKPPEAFDRSMEETKALFRNEAVNKGIFKWSPQWQMPDSGTIVFDFVYLPAQGAPAEADCLTDDQF